MLPWEGFPSVSAVWVEIWRSAVRNKLNGMLLVAIGVLAVSVPMLAHHGGASYDNEKKTPMSGVVTEWIWANPHCYLKVDEKTDNGEVKHWVIEASNPPDMSRQGWGKNSFKPGDQVTVLLTPAKNGQPIGRFGGKRTITLNGQPFPPGETPDDAPASKP
jgi:hypothetical protein